MPLTANSGSTRRSNSNQISEGLSNPTIALAAIGRRAGSEPAAFEALIAETANKIAGLGSDPYLSEKDVTSAPPGPCTIRWPLEKRQLGGAPPYRGIGRNIRYAKKAMAQWLTEQRR